MAAGSNRNKAYLSPAEARSRLSLAISQPVKLQSHHYNPKKLDILQKVTIPVGSTESGRWG